MKFNILENGWDWTKEIQFYQKLFGSKGEKWNYKEKMKLGITELEGYVKRRKSYQPVLEYLGKMPYIIKQLRVYTNNKKKNDEIEVSIMLFRSLSNILYGYITFRDWEFWITGNESYYQNPRMFYLKEGKEEVWKVSVSQYGAKIIKEKTPYGIQQHEKRMMKWKGKDCWIQEKEILTFNQVWGKNENNRHL